jgi:hypothetical protein
MNRYFLSRALMVAALVAPALPAAAAEKRAQAPAKESVPAACPADDRFAQWGLRAFIDPQTGQLREPSPEETRALAGAAREEFVRAVESLEAVVHPDGMISLDLKGLFMQDLVVVKRPDGSLSMQCVPDSERTSVTTSPAPAKPVPALEER